MPGFIHLHNHSHYSLLDGACRIKDLVEAAKKNDMPALALTDHGTMFGAIEFYKTCQKSGIKPIIGVEAYIAPRSRKEKGTQKSTMADTSFHLVLLAKNLQGYKNIMHLVSLGYLEGFYYRPRIDWDLLQEYHEGLVVLSACLKGEIAQKFLNGRPDEARQTALRYRELFGDDYYLEIHKHNLPEEDEVREHVVALSKDLSIPLVVTNDIHYLKREHASPHDVLICLQTGKDRDDPNRLRYTTDEIYFKSPAEMYATFKGYEEALAITDDIANKCDLKLDFSKVYLPSFELPQEHQDKTLDEYLAILAHEGLRRRYPEVTPELEHRLNYELETIKKTGYAGYFLIVADFINYARAQGIPVGPGRGSAAGSLASYCTGITNLDPMPYNLIFERFLNPERVTMPDIDVDFCYERRQEIIDYVRQKYGENNVTQIITFGTMAARAVVRDVGRVLKVKYSDVDKLAKMIPPTIGITLDRALESVQELKATVESNPVNKQLIEYSKVLEGLARHASTHAAGVVITPDALTNYTPLYKSNTGDVTTQYDMKSLETIGVLKMDFLGLRTLTVMQKTLEMLRARGIELDLDRLPMDDAETYALFGNGETISLFQFESSGMREYLKKLKPQCLEDLIAMNALYRPGPMDMIDDFIARKHGTKKIEYLHPLLEPVLKETYGVIVYQEQVMRIASELAGFTLGGADLLRRAMGKKNVELMAEQRKKFIEGCKERNIPANIANQIFDLMDKFAGYGFNKSHAAGYSLVAYQTAYLKAHYPAEFMAATLTSEMSNTSRIVTLIDECRHMGVPLLPPDVNTSLAEFTVLEGTIRYGLGAIKNVGLGAIDSVVKTRQKDGRFNSIYDFCARVDGRVVNKKVLESLVQSGAFDSISANRHQLLLALDSASAYSQRKQDERLRGQVSIFDDAPIAMETEPALPPVEDWDPAERLKREKEFLGVYLSAHPLERYGFEVKLFSHPAIQDLEEARDGLSVMVCGMVTEVKTIVDRNGRQMAFVTIEDFAASIEAIVFSDTLAEHRDKFQPDAVVVLVGKTSSREEEAAKILVESVMSLDEAWQTLPKGVALEVAADELDDKLAQRLLQTLRLNQGTCNFFLRFRGHGSPAYDFQARNLRIRPNGELIRTLQAALGKEAIKVDIQLPSTNGARQNSRQPYRQRVPAVA
ncbi:MAG: DNA polymerase III subunit alpha [bacterium]